MRRALAILMITILVIIVMMVGVSAAGAQTGSTTQAAPAAKAGTAAKPGGSATTATHAATKPTAVINTTAGKMTCTLFPDKAPVGVQNFIGLASGTKDWKNPVSGATKHGVPLYDGTIFHRVIAEFMIQGGDPAGTGSGADPVAPFKNEVSPDLLFDQPGRLAYANAGPGTNTSQFFITEVAFTGQQAKTLNGHYTIFGQCDEATVTLVKQIARMNTDANDRPFRPIKINHITILHGGSAPKPAGSATKKPVAATAPKAPADPK